MPNQTTRDARPTQLICVILLTIAFFVGLIFLILWLSLRPHRPRFHIQGLAVSGWGQQNGLVNAQIAYNITIRNANARIGIYYESITGSIYYKDQWVGSKPSADPFYQGPKNTTIFYTVLSADKLTADNQRWMEFVSDRMQGMIVLRLELRGIHRYRTSFWDSRRHRMHPRCDVAVGPDGLMLPSYINKKCHDS